VIVPDAVADGDNVVVPDDEPFMAKLETVVVPAIVCPPAVVSIVPVAAGTVIVFDPATAVGVSVMEPEVDPLSAKLPIRLPSKLMTKE